MTLSKWCALALLSSVAALSQAQQPAPIPAGGQAPVATDRSQELRPNYVLDTNDQILIRALDVDEMNDRPFRVDADGNLTLPLVGKVKASGLTVAQLEAELVRLLRAYVRMPQVVVTMVQLRNEPVFVVGAFRSPGIYPLLGRRTLIETLTAVGGLQPNASRRLKITRRLEHGRIPLPNAVEDTAAGTSVVEINLSRLLETTNPAEDIVLEPYDVIAARRAEMVYVSGEVVRSGGFELNDARSFSTTQLLSLSGGLTATAAPKKARVLRRIQDSAKRAEIPIDLHAVLSGRSQDFPLLADDVLVIPRTSQSRTMWTQMAMYSLPAVISAVIFASVR